MCGACPSKSAKRERERRQKEREREKERVTVSRLFRTRPRARICVSICACECECRMNDEEEWDMSRSGEMRAEENNLLSEFYRRGKHATVAGAAKKIESLDDITYYPLRLLSREYLHFSLFLSSLLRFYFVRRLMNLRDLMCTTERRTHSRLPIKTGFSLFVQTTNGISSTTRFLFFIYTEKKIKI